MTNPEEQENTRDESGRFLPGISGNPNGRPKFSLVTILKEELQKVPDGEKDTHAVLLIRKMLHEAIKKGNDAQVRNILQYIEGMPKQQIEHSGEMPILVMDKRTYEGNIPPPTGSD